MESEQPQTLMIFFLSLFLFSLLGLCTMIAWRLLAMRAGKVPIHTGSGFPYALFVEEIAIKAGDEAKRLFLIVSAKTLYSVSKAFDFAKGAMRRQVVRMEEKLAHSALVARRRQGAVSLFLKDIAEHKKMMKVKIRRQARRAGE